MLLRFQKGNFVNDGRRTGVVHEVYANGQVVCLFHNGVKIKTYIVEPSKLKAVSQAKFIDYIRRSGNTSFTSYLRMPLTLSLDK